MYSNAADSPAVRMFCCFTRRRTDSIKHPRAIGKVTHTIYYYFADGLLFSFSFFHFLLYVNLPPLSTSTQRTTKTGGGGGGGDDYDDVYTKNYYEILISLAGYIAYIFIYILYT